MVKRILAWNDAAGQFYREIGKKPNGKAVRFYLGADEKQATACVGRLEGLWGPSGTAGGTGSGRA